MATRTPHEIARETVKQLTARKLAPTPENFQSVYCEIAGTKPLVPFPLEPMRQMTKALPTQSPGQQRLVAQLENAISMHNWDNVQKALVAYVHLGPAKTPVHAPVAVGAPAAASVPSGLGSALPPDLCEQMARIVDHALPAVGNDDQKLLEQAQDLVRYLRLPAHEPAALRMMMANFAHRLSFAAEEQGAVKSALLELVRMIFENVGELSLDNDWLKGQMDALMAACQPPLSIRRLESLQSRLKDVIFKQAEAREKTLAAQEEMKRSLAAFIERLGQMTEQSGSFSQKIERCAQQLENAKNLSEITPVLQEAIAASRSMAIDSERSREELQRLREQSEESEREIARLQQELDRASSMARHDPLTGVLNRKGMDEAVERELGRTQRTQNPMCVALLDIDNFKKLNDQHGHQTGDAALQHLTQVAQKALRPQDTMARYGGEEFVIVLPDTALEQGVEAMTRVQRELTKTYFLQGNERLLITFSAGVAQVQANESGADAIKRADQGMYLAKRAGKNRVIGV